MKSIKWISLCLIVFTMLSCTASKKTVSVEVVETPKTEDCKITHKKYLKGSTAYLELLPGDNITAFKDQEITFYGKISDMPMQHMMRSSPAFDDVEPEKHKYIEPSSNYKGGQIVAYYLESKVKWPEKKDELRFFGTIKSMSGAGKGGGEHTEYYLMLDAVE